MCDPVTIMASVAVVSSITASVAASQSAAANAKVIKNQSEIRGKQIQAQAGQEQNMAAMRARQERSASIAAASGANINLGSNSFMGSLQTTTMNQSNESGLILENEQNQQQANTAETQSLLNEKATSPTFMGATLNAALSGTGSYMQGKALYDLGKEKPNPVS